MVLFAGAPAGTGEGHHLGVHDVSELQISTWHPAYLHELLPEVGVEPAVEDRVADTGAHGDDMAQTEGEEIYLKNCKSDIIFIIYLFFFQNTPLPPYDAHGL